MKQVQVVLVTLADPSVPETHQEVEGSQRPVVLLVDCGSVVFSAVVVALAVLAVVAEAWRRPMQPQLP